MVYAEYEKRRDMMMDFVFFFTHIFSRYAILIIVSTNNILCFLKVVHRCTDRNTNKQRKYNIKRDTRLETC